jgi:hypothetical protein
MCGENEWEKGSIQAGELFENFTFISESKKDSAIMGRIHGMVCVNCGFVLTFIGQDNLPNGRK